jgi:F0F1-type ATP synthase alpha subunit
MSDWIGASNLITLPIIEMQVGEVFAYIPIKLISIING